MSTTATTVILVFGRRDDGDVHYRDLRRLCHRNLRRPPAQQHRCEHDGVDDQRTYPTHPYIIIDPASICTFGALTPHDRTMPA